MAEETPVSQVEPIDIEQERRGVQDRHAHEEHRGADDGGFARFRARLDMPETCFRKGEVNEHIAGFERGILGGVIGARLALRLGARKKILARTFAGIVLVVAAYMLYVNVAALHLLR